MSEVIDLISLAIADFEAERRPLRVFAWFDYATENWRGVRRNRRYKHSAYTKPWPMDWDIVNGGRYQFAVHNPDFWYMPTRSSGSAS